VQDTRKLLRFAAVTALAIWSLGHTLPDTIRFWRPLGTFGYRSNIYGKIVSVRDGSPAAAAGLKPGDHIDFHAEPPEYRSKIRYVLSPGVVVPLAFSRAGQRHSVLLKAEPEKLSGSQKLVLAARLFAAVFFTLVGGFLVLARPSVITWSFYLLCVGLNPGPFEVSMAIFQYPWIYLYYALQDIITVAGGLGALLFALLFPRTSIYGWRQRLVRLTPYLFAIVSALNIYADLASNFFGLRSHAPAIILSSTVVLSLVVVIYAFYDTYVHTRGNDRQRIRWIIFGFIIGLTGATVSFALPLNMSTPDWLSPSLLLLIVFVPTTVAYAVIRHHVIDVNFVISRALVYSIMTTMLVAFFAFIDWLLGKELAAGRLALTSEVMLAIAAGVGLEHLQHAVDHSVNSVLFRDRQAAAKRLARLTQELQDAPSKNSIDKLLVDVPSQALRLSSSAIFRRSNDGSYTRRASHGWDEMHEKTLDANAPLVLKLASKKRSVRINKLALDRARFPQGSAEPALALPITIRGESIAVGLYGIHSGGEDLAPDEISAIDGLELYAAAAYDRLEVDALRSQLEEVNALRQRVAALSQEIQTLRTPERQEDGSSNHHESSHSA